MLTEEEHKKAWDLINARHAERVKGPNADWAKVPCQLVKFEWVTVPTHISNIKCGDVVEINGIDYTVGKKDIKYDSFMGYTLRGDSYRNGTDPVRLKVYRKIQ